MSEVLTDRSGVIIDGDVHPIDDDPDFTEVESDAVSPEEQAYIEQQLVLLADLEDQKPQIAEIVVDAYRVFENFHDGKKASKKRAIAEAIKHLVKSISSLRESDGTIAANDLINARRRLAEMISAVLEDEDKPEQELSPEDEAKAEDYADKRGISTEMAKRALFG